MAYHNSNEGYIGIGSQSTTPWQGNLKTTAVTPTWFPAYISDSITPEIREELLFEGSDPGKYDIDSIKMQHVEKIAFSCYARPKIAANLYAAMLGNDSPTHLTTTPFYHTITVATTDQPTTPMSRWLTIEKMLTGTTNSMVQRIVGAKINSIALSAEQGGPVLMEVEGTGVTAELRTTASTPTFETGSPFSMYHSVLMVNAPTTTSFEVKSFNVKITCENEEMQDGSFGLHDIFNKKITAEVDLTLNYEDFTLWRKANYGGTNAPAEGYSDSTLEVRLETTAAGTSERSVNLLFPLIRLKPHLIALDPQVKMLEQPFTGIALKKNNTTTQLVTVTCFNTIATTLPL